MDYLRQEDTTTSEEAALQQGLGKNAAPLEEASLEGSATGGAPFAEAPLKESEVPVTADSADGSFPDDEPVVKPAEPADVIHFDSRADEPDQLSYLEALAARMAQGDTGIEDALPLFREDIELVQALCTRPFDGTCDRCVKVCPHEAIRITDDLPRIDDERCTNCGLCAGICDGFSSVRITLEDLTKRALEIAEDGLAVTFACNDLVPLGTQVAENVLVIPCLAYLPPEALTFLLANGAQVNVCCDFALCNSCQVAGGMASQLFEHCFTMAESQTDAQIGFVDAVPTTLSLTETLAQDSQEESSRRNMLSSLSNTVTDVASGHYRAERSSSARDYQENRERMRARGHIKQHEGMTLEEFTSDHRIPKYWPRRSLALRAAQADEATGAALSLWVSATDDPLCCQAHDCVDACPTGARQIDEGGKLAYDESYCIACGSCISACKAGACGFVETTALELFRKTQQLS